MLLSFASVVGVGVFAWVGYRALVVEFPDVSVLKTQYPQVVYRGKKQHFEIRWAKARPNSWVTAGEISRAAIGAVVVSEDWAFYQHKGYDAHQIKEAIEEDWKAPGKIRGASTITQQVVKNVFLTSERSLWRKVKELWLAIRMEDAIPKQRILETYLNIAEWGEGVFGIAEAAKTYFGKTPAQLTAREGAFLAMLLPSPKRYSQSFKQRQLTSYAEHTMATILSKMERAHYLTPDERASELKSRMPFEQSLPEAGTGEDLESDAESLSQDLPELEDPVNLPDGLTHEP